MSLAIATASRDDRPSSTIGVDSLIASGDCPVALAIQLRSHSRISATVMSVRASGAAGGEPDRPVRSVMFSDHLAIDRQPLIRRRRGGRSVAVCQLFSRRQSVSSGKALATFPLRRLPSR